MRLTNKELGRYWGIEVGCGEFKTISLKVTAESTEAEIVISQVDALSLARIIEEQVRENRRK